MVALVNIPKRGAGPSELRNEGAGGHFAPFPLPIRFDWIRSKACFIKRLCIAVCPPRFLDLPCAMGVVEQALLSWMIMTSTTVQGLIKCIHFFDFNLGDFWTKKWRSLINKRIGAAEFFWCKTNYKVKFFWGRICFFSSSFLFLAWVTSQWQRCQIIQDQ